MRTDRRDFLRTSAAAIGCVLIFSVAWATEVDEGPKKVEVRGKQSGGPAAASDVDINRKRGASDDGGTAKPLDVDRFFHGFAVKPATYEPHLFKAGDAEIWLLHRGPQGQLRAIITADAGRTWDTPRDLIDPQGRAVQGFHATLLRLKSGRLGLVHSSSEVPEARTGRDGGTVFRSSEDGGKTWSDPAVVERRFGICCTGHALVLSSGRIVVPVFRWISHEPTGAAEAFNAASVSYSYAYVSDDEGKTWTQSLSELFVSHYRAAYDLEEPAVIELRDGRLLMHLRSQLGRMYRSYSSDQGISWTRPEALPFAAGYTPCMLKRLPGGEILMIWNQVSRMEILNGFHRHRLSVAVSADDGQTWGNFKNLESLDDTAVVQPMPLDRIEVLEQWEDYGYHQPVNAKRYHRAPGVLRICYPDVAIIGDEAMVAYDFGHGTLGEGVNAFKVRAIPLTWFTTK